MEHTIRQRQREERGLKARRTAFLGVVYQGVYALSQLVALGLLIRHEGPERFGLWMTVLALTTWLPLATVGQNSALLTGLGAVALTDRAAARRIFSSSTLVLGTMSILLLVLFTTVGPVLPWSHLLNAEGPMTRNVATTTTVVALVVAMATFPATQGGFAIFAHQRGDVVHVTMIASSLLGLALVAAAVRMGWPLWAVGALTLAGPALGGLALWGFGLSRGLVPRPGWSCIDRSSLRSVIRTGLHFLIIDATTLVLLRTPEVIVARLHGVESVGPFAAVGRLSALLLALFQVILLPLWPALGDAAARGDREWINRAVGRSLRLVLGLWIVGALGIRLLGPAFIERWLGLSQFADRGLIAAAVAQTLGQALLAWLSVLLGGLSLQRYQALASGAAAVTFLPLAAVCGTRFGPVGVAGAQAAALLLCAIPLGVAALYRNLPKAP